MRHRVHGKMHKSVDVALLQDGAGRACGVCCQKVSEAEVFARGGIKDVLVQPGDAAGKDRPFGADPQAGRAGDLLRGRSGERRDLSAAR